MQRRIIGFHRDTSNDWVAELDCFHGQHVRHNPPFAIREWTETQAGRERMLGTELQCPKCDRLEWPEDLVAYKRTPEFGSESFPAGLARDHSTKTGVWGKIHVLEGTLLYVVQEPATQEFTLTPTLPGIVVPEMRHHVVAQGYARFFVEFFTLVASQT